MSDLISRQAVLEWIGHLDVDFANSFDPHTLTEIYRCIKEMPSVENKGEWIPVSERLPENNEDVLVYNSSDIFVAWYSEIVRSWGSVDDRFDENTPILAWQPLPEPYKGVSE